MVGPMVLREVGVSEDLRQVLGRVVLVHALHEEGDRDGEGLHQRRTPASCAISSVMVTFMARSTPGAQPPLPSWLYPSPSAA